MTLLEIERLIRKISETLQQGSSSDLAHKLSEDFAVACRMANHRLQQCEAMIKAGDRHQAIQLAETAPNLLDLVTVLEFQRTDEWRGFCKKRGLSPAESIDGHAVQALNSCYAQGIPTDHPLYAAYRKAVMMRNDEGALAALQSITRLNPTDANAQSELERLDGKVLAARLQNLAGMIPAGNPVLVTEAVEAIESVGFRNRPSGDVWTKAAVLRCQHLLDQSEKRRGDSNWVEVLGLTDFVRQLENDLNFVVDATDAQRLVSLEGWSRSEQEKDRQNREFATLLGELRKRIHRSEEKDTSARQVGLTELREDFEGIHKIWRAILDFARPVSTEVTNAFRKRTSLLESEIARRESLKRRTILIGSAAATVVITVLVWVGLGQIRAREFTKQLDAAISKRATRTVENLLEAARSTENKTLNLMWAHSQVARADTSVARERGLLTNFMVSMERLPTQLDEDADADALTAVASKLSEARVALEALAHDFKAELEPRFSGFERRWKQYLLRRGTDVNAKLEVWISSAEKESVKLDYRAKLEVEAERIRSLSVTLRRIDGFEAGFTNHVTIRSDLLQRAKAFRTKFKAYERELQKIENGLEAVSKAKTAADHASALTLIASSEFSGDLAVLAAKGLRAIDSGEERFLRSLVGATNPATWSFIRSAASTNFIPAARLPAETERLEELQRDPAVNASHQRYRLWRESENNQPVEWITAGALSDSAEWSLIKAYVVSDEEKAEFFSRDYGQFNGRWKLSPTVTLKRIETLPPPKEASAFGQIGLEKIFTGNTSYGLPMLQVLDNLKRSSHGSPVFRAYLFCALVDFMELQPDGWGLSFCPSTRIDAGRIREHVGGPIASGDWFVRAKADNWSLGLQQILETNRSTLYRVQAQRNLVLVRAVAKDGLRFIGYADVNGKPVTTTDKNPSEIWGYSAADLTPTLIKDRAMPLSPLFGLNKPRSEYLSEAGVSSALGALVNTLPPLFRDPDPR